MVVSTGRLITSMILAQSDDEASELPQRGERAPSLLAVDTR